MATRLPWGIRRRAPVTLLAGLAMAPVGVSGQLEGRVLDEVTSRPVPDAVVQLMDRTGATRATSRTDEAGRWRLVLEGAQSRGYYLLVEALGYRGFRSPLLALGAADVALLDLMLRPEPVGLAGLEVSVDMEGVAAETLASAGMSLRDLGRRWISEAEIDAIEIKADVGSLIERQGVSDVRVIRPENQQPGGDDLGLCVSQARGRTAAGLGTCALTVLNGAVITREHMLLVDPYTVGAVAVLTPIEATMMYGTRGATGALLVWTRQGGARR